MAAIIAIQREKMALDLFLPEPAYEAWLSDGGDTVPDIDDDEPPEPPKPSGRPSLRVAGPALHERAPFRGLFCFWLSMAHSSSRC